MSGDLTEPHDYRVLLETFPDVTIVGGQAITAWAIAYLSPDPREGYGSHDMDVLAKGRVAEIIAAFPDWKSEVPPLWSFDRRLLRLTTYSPDGRLLAIEVLGKVRGLDAADLKAVSKIERDGLTYHVLDPIAMLRAKAANVREINQDGPPPRNDRPHLHLIAQCVPLFLSDMHRQASSNPSEYETFSTIVSRAFRALSDSRTQKTLLKEGIRPLELIPPELTNSPIEKVRTTCAHQLPRLKDAIAAY